MGRGLKGARPGSAHHCTALRSLATRTAMPTPGPQPSLHIMCAGQGVGSHVAEVLDCWAVWRAGGAAKTKFCLRA